LFFCFFFFRNSLHLIQEPCYTPRELPALVSNNMMYPLRGYVFWGLFYPHFIVHLGPTYLLIPMEYQFSSLFSIRLSCRGLPLPLPTLSLLDPRSTMFPQRVSFPTCWVSILDFKASAGSRCPPAAPSQSSPPHDMTAPLNWPQDPHISCLPLYRKS